MTPFFSALETIWANGRYTSPPNNLNLQDLNADMITVILPSRFYNEAQAKINVFEYNYFERKRKKNSVYIFPNPVDGNTGIAALKVWYDANVTNTLTTYTKLLTIDKIHDQKVDPLTGLQPSILINDAYVVHREWDPNWVPVNSTTGDTVEATHIHVNIGDGMDYKIFTVQGNQTKVGTQYYALY